MNVAAEISTQLMLNPSDAYLLRRIPPKSVKKRADYGVKIHLSPSAKSDCHGDDYHGTHASSTTFRGKKKKNFVPLFMKIRRTVSSLITGHGRTDVVST